VMGELVSGSTHTSPSARPSLLTSTLDKVKIFFKIPIEISTPDFVLHSVRI
jgi:hypothetical protein